MIAPRGKIDLGLVVEDELVARDAVTQVEQQGQVIGRLRLVRRRRRRRGPCPIAWPSTSPDRRDAAGRRCWRRAPGTGRCRRSARRERSRRRSGSRARTPAGSSARPPPPPTGRAPAGQDPELVPAEPGHGVALAQGRDEPLADLLAAGVSPRSWPSVSLTCLKPSRSIIEHRARLVVALGRRESPDDRSLEQACGWPDL